LSDAEVAQVTIAVEEARREYPFVSLRDRLAYESVHRSARRVMLSADAASVLELMEEKE